MNIRLSVPLSCLRQSAACAISLLFMVELPARSQQADLTITNTLKVEANPNASRLELRGNGILLGRGASATDNLPSSDLAGTSPLLMWNPAKSAFRAGTFLGLNASGIGIGSAAFGYGSYASGYGAFAAGGGNASADYAVAVGAGAQAIGYSSVAFGIWTIAIQPASFASGYAAFATGYSSVATGYVTQAVGNYSTASNQQTLAYGQAATAMGISTRADTLGSVAIGRFNVGVADSGGWTAWRPTDPIFEVGNGASATQRANAFTVYKNGTAEVAGYPIVTASTFPTYLGNGSVANIALSSGPNRSISVNASSTGAGNDLKIQAGNSANGTDLAGGSLVLSAGSSTGSAGSAIEFRTAMGGSLGGGIAAPATRLKINALGGIEAGQGLTAAAAPQLVIGKYNNSANDGTGNHGQGLFVVGAGTGVGTNAKNAMRVLEDGTIVIQPAGDIDMGIFNEGERP